MSPLRGSGILKENSFLQTGRPYGARVLPIPSGSTNRSPLWGSGVTDTFWFYKQVAPMGFGCSRYILVLQTGRCYAAWGSQLSYRYINTKGLVRID